LFSAHQWEIIKVIESLKRAVLSACAHVIV
jgi:hypothetical protein